MKVREAYKSVAAKQSDRICKHPLRDSFFTANWDIRI